MLFSRYTSPWGTHKDTFFLLLSQQLQLLLFGHTNLALYAHAHRLSFSVTVEDKQVETGFFGLFLETYCKLSIFDLHLSNQKKNTSVSNIYICLVCPVMKGWIVPNALKQWRIASITHITKKVSTYPHISVKLISYFLTQRPNTHQ